ncbi:hypothetical protein BOVATA_017730 [Babesia ovata]|uniref:Uncharacterized protein n=1 Tax=Babesia ovata TaxID=189622 RepID=A0A2H6KBA8_9APIC|nr:uncharacterized protein BOVATA_017730 [Babesia ovata]GBE60280.1 hypothetical protein BOVATA_017730 [Babesia ovata]
MAASSCQPSHIWSKSAAYNTVNQVTVEAQSVITTGQIHRVPAYKDLRTVIYIWGNNPAVDPADKTHAKAEWEPSIYRQLPDIRIASVSCGPSYMMLLSSCHRLFALGRGDYGQLGLGASLRRVTAPTPISDLPTVTEVVCGAYHCVAIASGGNLFSWGRNDVAGHQEGFTTCSPRELTFMGSETKCRTVSVNQTLTVCACDGGTSLYHWGFSFAGEKIQQPQLFYTFDQTRIRQVALGKSFGLAVSDSGTVYGWGDRTYGELLSLGKRQEPSYFILPTLLKLRHIHGVVSVATGDRHALLLDESGKVWSLGENMYGQCGVPPCHHSSPMQVDFSDSSFPVSKVACGPRHSACVNSGNQLFTWGHSSDHKLIFTSSVDMLVQQQRQPGVSASSGLKNCCSHPQLIYALLHEKVACLGLAAGYTVVVTGEGIVSSEELPPTVELAPNVEETPSIEGTPTVRAKQTNEEGSSEVYLPIQLFK